MNLKNLGAAALLSILPVCKDAEFPQTSDNVESSAKASAAEIEQACVRFRGALGMEMVLDGIVQHPRGEKLLGGFDEQIAKENRAETLAALKDLEEKGGDAIECAKRTD